ncbi:MAG: glucose-6-phosphate isomerase [Actinomycetota bacterium]|nr:glucose-6-phosphate isomerase [Actinomycetota bacterium]
MPPTSRHDRRSRGTVLSSNSDLVRGIWARDKGVWTNADEDRWLGWLDAPLKGEHVLEAEFAEQAREAGLDTCVLLGMGGSSLAPEVLKRTFDAKGFHVLDTTHPAMIRHVLEFIDFERTLFIASSKSGSTLETRSHLDFFWEKTGRDGSKFAAVTDPGSSLESEARRREFRAIFAGDPTIGGRYSALSAFGLVPAAVMEIDVGRLLERAREMVDACRLDEGNPGLELGLQLGDGWREGRDKVCIDETDGGFGLWAEQLIAESTGKQGKGLIPAPGESPEGPDRQRGEVRLPDPYELGQEFFRWEFAVAAAGSILGINPFDQPDVQAAKDRTKQVLDSGEESRLEPESSPEELFAQAREGDYVCIQAFIDPLREGELQPLVELARQTGCVVTQGLGPRYLHSTGQLHKGGPNTGLFLQVVDETGAEIAIPNQPFGFGKLIRAQAAGDFESLRERGRRVARVRLEDV